jgi:TIR domain-containing protein
MDVKPMTPNRKARTRRSSSKIFINYRRDDSADFAGRINDELVRRFGNVVFFDVTVIPIGDDFINVVRAALAKCKVLLVIIGPRWIHARNEDGTPRLHDEHDLVRVEIAEALDRKIPVIPILRAGTPMPTAEQLPDGLKELARCNALEMRHSAFKRDVNELVRRLRDTGVPPTASARAVNRRAISPTRHPLPLVPFEQVARTAYDQTRHTIVGYAAESMGGGGVLTWYGHALWDRMPIFGVWTHALSHEEIPREDRNKYIMELDEGRIVLRERYDAGRFEDIKVRRRDVPAALQSIRDLADSFPTCPT